MKCIHLGDLHLGKIVNDYHMIEDQKYILNEILELIRKEQVDAALLAGDIYDKSIPSEEAVRLLDWFLSELSKAGVQVFLISGNHDSDERLHFGSSFFEKSGIHIASKYEGTLTQKKYEDEYGEVNVYLLPFIKASQVRHFYPEKEILTYEDAVKVVLDQVEIDTAKRNILLAHQFVAGKGEKLALGGSESLNVQSVGAVEVIGWECLSEFDYVALGHIHSPQKVGKETIRYAGSPLKYSLSEIRNEKSIPIITLKEKGCVSVELYPLKPRREMRHLKGKLEQLLQKETVSETEDYIYMTLTDEHPIPDALNIIREFYPNLMKLDYENAHTKAVETADVGFKQQKIIFSDLISEFYQEMFGCEISKEELDYMKTVAKEAGVINETN